MKELLSGFRSSTRAPLLQTLKAAVATVAAWLLAAWLFPGELPVFAAIAALLVVQPSVAVALLVNILIVPPVLVEPARRDVGMLGREIAASLDRLADALPQQQTRAQLAELMIEVRLLRPMQDAATASLSAADEALTLNPRSRRHREPLAVLHRLQDRLSPVITQVIGMTRAYYDQYDDSLPAEPAARAIAEQLHKAAHDVRLAVQESPVGVEPSDETSAIPALTAPLVVQPPSSGHWILIGSLMEDLRRIHNGMTDDE